MANEIINSDTDTELENQIITLVNAAKMQIAVTINRTLTELYWHIGNLINTAILDNQRADYSKHLVENISRRLTEKFGRGWSVKQIHRFMQFAKVFPLESRYAVATINLEPY